MRFTKSVLSVVAVLGFCASGTIAQAYDVTVNANLCIQSASANVFNYGKGGSGYYHGSSYKPSCVNKSTFSMKEWNAVFQRSGYAKGDVDMYMANLKSPTVEFVCANGVGGDGLGAYAGNVGVQALQVCENGIEGVNNRDDLNVNVNGCINTASAHVVNIGKGGYGGASKTSCYNKSSMSLRDWQATVQSTYASGGDVSVSSVDLADPSIRFVCLSGTGGAGLGTGSGNTDVVAYQSCKNTIED